MPADISTTFAPGSSTTTTRGTFPMGGGYGYGAQPDFLNWLINRKRIDTRPKFDDYHEPDPDTKAVRESAARAEIAKNQALTSPAPMRQVSGPNIIPGNVMDTNAMTGAQREVYLPKGAGVAPPEHAGLGPSAAGPSPEPSEAATATERERSDRDFRLRQQFAEEQKRQSDEEARYRDELNFRKRMSAGKQIGEGAPSSDSTNPSYDSGYTPGGAGM